MPSVMNNPLRHAPLPVRLAALLLVALSVSDAIVALCIFPREIVAQNWASYILTFARAFSLAAGLLLGINLFRLVLIAFAVFGLVVPLVQGPLTGLPALMTPLAIAQRVVLLVSLGLSLLPASGRYFGRHGWDNIRLNPALGDQPGTRLAWGLPLALLTIFAGSIVGQQMRAPALTAERVSQAISAPAQSPEEIVIGRHLRLLWQMADQFALEHPDRVPRFEDLVGDGQRSPSSAPTPHTGKYIQGLKPAFGESYPEEYPRAVPLVATLPDGTRIVLDRKTSKVMRFPGRGADALPAPPKIVLTLERAHELAILNNCRMLTNAAGQYAVMNNVLEAPLAELVGPGKMIAQLRAVRGERYPTEISTEKPVIVTLKDGTRLTPDATFSQLVPASAP